MFLESRHGVTVIIYAQHPPLSDFHKMKCAQKYTPLREFGGGKTLLRAAPMLEELSVARTGEEIRRGLKKFADEFGVSGTGYLSVFSRAPNSVGHYSLTDRMENYTADYLEQGLVKIDPIFWRGQRELRPIPWGLSEHRTNLASGEKTLYSLLDDYKIKCGVLVPLHGPNGYSVFAVFLDENAESFRKRITEFSAVAQFVASHVHDAVHQLVGISKTDAIPNLTPRERECLTWVAAGKTAWEIGQILKLAETTVVFYSENAKKKLEAKTMPQAVARAISLGLIYP